MFLLKKIFAKMTQRSLAKNKSSYNNIHYNSQNINI